tara:strand:- start:263 stop:646 length:384 start_codon:yes stop_codon:yes gene_type:complete
MKIENLIENNQHKILFLKAILLGIKYGKMNNNEYYEQSIINEIQKIVNDDPKYTDNLVNKIDNKINKGKIIKNMNDLENLRTNIIKNINNLSYNNYNNNYVKINYLRVQLINLNKELDYLNNQLKEL